MSKASILEHISYHPPELCKHVSGGFGEYEKIAQANPQHDFIVQMACKSNKGKVGNKKM